MYTWPAIARALYNVSGVQVSVDLMSTCCHVVSTLWLRRWSWCSIIILKTIEAVSATSSRELVIVRVVVVLLLRSSRSRGAGEAVDEGLEWENLR